MLWVEGLISSCLGLLQWNRTCARNNTRQFFAGKDLKCKGGVGIINKEEKRVSRRWQRDELWRDHAFQSWK